MTHVRTILLLTKPVGLGSHAIKDIFLYWAYNLEGRIVGASCVAWLTDTPNFHTSWTERLVIPCESLASFSTTKSASAPGSRVPFLLVKPNIAAGTEVIALIADGIDTSAHRMRLFKHWIRVTQLRVQLVFRACNSVARPLAFLPVFHPVPSVLLSTPFSQSFRHLSRDSLHLAAQAPT